MNNNCIHTKPAPLFDDIATELPNNGTTYTQSILHTFFNICNRYWFSLKTAIQYSETRECKCALQVRVVRIDAIIIRASVKCRHLD